QGRHHRQRHRRQEADRRHGHPAAAAERDAQTRRRRRRAGPGHLPRLAGRRPAPARRSRRPRAEGSTAVIASLTGRVTAITPDAAVVEVGGVGVLVHCTPGTLATLKTGQETRLATSLVVREESLTLYGFATDDERTVFELLQTASGVGPKLALAMLAVHTPQALRVAVAGADLKALTQVPGIGQKGAQRIVLELKDRLGASPEAVDAALNGPRQDHIWREQVHSG